MSNHLMASRRFAPLFWTQFLSAFNDNFLKNTLVFLILFKLGEAEAASLITAAGAIFIAPFLLLSALGGELADRFDKALVARRLKLAEVGAAVVAVSGLALGSIPVLLGALFLFGVVSALFGPVKYGILPDHLEQRELPRANAWVEGATFAAILGGTIVAGLVAASGGVSVTVFAPMMIGLALACYGASRLIPATGAAAPDLAVDRNFLRSTWRLVRELRGTPRLWRAGLFNAWFWFAGAIVLSVLPPLVKQGLGGSEIAVTAYLAVFAVAIGTGSAMAAWMSAGRIILLPAPLGTALMTVISLDLVRLTWGLEATGAADTLPAFFAQPGTVRIAIDLALLAIAGAFVAVPTFAALQAWAPESRRARVIAAANVLSAGFMTVGGAAIAAAQAAGVSIAAVMALLAIANAAAAFLMLQFLPTSGFRDFVSILFRAFHRLEVEGLENIAKAGPAPVLALNHVSFLDGPLALTLTDEEPVFAIDYKIARALWVRPFLKLTRAMPLDPTRPMATRSLIRAVREGNPLVIFPEGRITVTGSLMKVYDGAAIVADKTGSMVVPIRIRGLEQSPFSRLTPLFIRKRLFPKVKVTILEPVRLSVDPALRGRKRREAAGAALYAIMTDLVFRTSLTEETVPERLIRTAHERGMGAVATEDPLTGTLTYGRLLTAAAALGADFAGRFPEERTIGVMLPNANGTIATVLGLMSAGKVPAMLNFSAGLASLRAACKAAEVRTVLCSRAFVDQAKLGEIAVGLAADVRFIWMEDVRQGIGTGGKLRGWMERERTVAKSRADDPAVILFTSGSEGTPKGVVLTHRNILANTMQAASRIDFTVRDKVFNALPMFHSFGLTAGALLPLTAGVPVYFYPSPLHYRIVPELVYATNATILFGTDTFLAGYARMAHPYDFRSVRYVFAGAEPVKAATRQLWSERFGLRLLEGYGVTETAPVISLNTPMFNRLGTVGKIMPGMEWKLQPVPGVEDGGRLCVRGPNVMAGYLRAENPGVLEAPADGWHDTGDIVTVDADGFIVIRGRAKRFAKIGGEMVSLAAVEAIAAEVWRSHASAVAAVKDPRKGERLILLTEAPDADRDAFMAFARRMGAPDLMLPAAVMNVHRLPILGSGKVDFAAVQRMAEQAGAETGGRKVA
ncbi:acyl-[ACP]--phospholipid O-acyltransferase [Zhengella mangrovi]|uniref:Acyl-[ACP]--phospholipid O-acyltransferase n=1 Tax=Zhengella mangrovi TaxID=1982044 RepID=A0A2G1QLN1_9HYPH|nr:acyl-[ACP]--phospholipid O-acyltransferase [Zhengella mangrovi]PHP66379.1 acyl-[ACP]--phospholipid O-acyltransferase [Zhengella mangrovi]